MFSNIVINVFNNPKNAGRISKPDGIADCYNLDNTAHVEFSLRIENGIILDCKFRAQANPYIIAICSTITNMLKGKMVSMIFLDPYSIKKELGDEEDYDIIFCIDCVKMAIQDYKEKLEKENKETKKTKKEIEGQILPKEEAENIKDEKEFIVEDIIAEDNINEVETEDIEETSIDDDFDFSDFFDDEDI